MQHLHERAAPQTSHTSGSGSLIRWNDLEQMPFRAAEFVDRHAKIRLAPASEAAFSA